GPERVQADEHVRVDRGSPLAVTCSAKGNPKPNLTWSRRPTTPNSTERVVGAGVGVVTLRAASATKDYTGVYLCRASNVVASAPPIRTRVIVSQAAAAVRDYGNSQAAWASVGGVGRLECHMRAAPPPSFVWARKDGLTLLNSGKYTIHEPQSYVVSPI
ncbi:lachesin-like, partial [Penaeus japonicus]|uniref:lachesin-like n=1 Tax=Penaeus japonicus TaxID=27405 RepID=UPI001C712C90